MDRSDAIEQFTRYLQRRAPGRRTAIDYTSDVRQFAAECAKPWRDVQMQDIDAFVDGQRQAGMSRATIRRRVAALKVFFDFLAEETQDLSWPNPVRFKRHAGKPAKTLPRDLKDDEIAQVWAVITAPRDRAWFALMLRGGLRVGEVVNLTTQDLLRPATAEQPAQLRVCGKGQKERLVLLSTDAYAILLDWLVQRPRSEATALFLNERGQPLTVSGIEWLLGRYGAQAGVPLTPHQLRHTYARQLTEAGIPITSLSKLLGHAQVTTTQIYTAGADPQLAQAYQTAMARLAPNPMPLAASPAASPLPAASKPLLMPPVPPPPDWAAWAPHLPAALRQASIGFVQRHWPDWKPQRRRLRALHVLAELRRFWEWQDAHRPISELQELHLADLQAYQTARRTAGAAAQTVNDTLKYVLALLREQADQGQALDAGVFRLHPLRPPDSLPRHLSESQSQLLERWVQGRLGSCHATERLENACFFVLAHGGLRASECTDLQVQDLDLPGQRLLVRQGKGLKDRLVYLTPTACQALGCYLTGALRPPQAPLFCYADGGPISYGWLHAHMAKLGQTAGVAQLTPHRLRHTLATRLINAGMPVTGIQRLLGHQHLDTTLIYARVADRVVENDYRQAMAGIERQQMPLSDTPLPVAWFSPQPDQTPAHYNQLDNSV